MNTAAQLCQLCADDYAGRLTALVPSLAIDGASATFTSYGADVVLVVRGTDELSDWRMYNLTLDRAQAPGDSGLIYHAGFLRYSQLIYGYARAWMLAGKPLAMMIGHSLGAAAIQIAGPALGVRAIGFGAPRVLYSSGSESNRAGLVDLYCALDDSVCSLPPFARHVVVPTWLHHPGTQPRDALVAHHPGSYASLLEMST
jgi:hypothetical protein